MSIIEQYINISEHSVRFGFITNQIICQSENAVKYVPFL